MGGLLGCGRCLLIGFNIFWMILGLVLLAIGAAVKFLQDIAKNFLKTLFDSLSSAGAGNAALPAQAAKEFTGLIDKISIPLIIIGVILFLIGIFGCCGACYKNKIMLIIYAVVVGLILLTEILAIIIIVAKKEMVKSTLGGEIRTYINKYYDDQAVDIGSLLLNMGMTMGQCCGLRNYHDFDNATNWNRTITVDGATYTKETPMACCKLKNPGFSMKIPTQSDFVNVTCIYDPTPETSNFEIGCWSKIEAAVKAQLPWVLTITILFILLQALLFACAILIARDKSD